MSDTRWYYVNDCEEVIGPVTAAGLSALFQSGEISRETFICQEGAESWILFPEVFAVPLPKSPVPPAAVPVTAGPSFTSLPKPTADAGAAKGCTGCLLAGVGLIVICIIIGALSDHSSPSSSSRTSDADSVQARARAYAVENDAIIERINKGKRGELSPAEIDRLKRDFKELHERLDPFLEQHKRK